MTITVVPIRLHYASVQHYQSHYHHHHSEPSLTSLTPSFSREHHHPHAITIGSPQALYCNIMPTIMPQHNQDVEINKSELGFLFRVNAVLEANIRCQKTLSRNNDKVAHRVTFTQNPKYINGSGQQRLLLEFDVCCTMQRQQQLLMGDDKGLKNYSQQAHNIA